MGIIDITDIIFPPGDFSVEDKRRIELYCLASEEAAKIVRSSSPLNLLNKTREIYKGYLQKENLKYDEERGL